VPWAEIGGWVQWLTLIIPATWEAEIRRIAFGGLSRQKVSETLISISQEWWGALVVPVTPEVIKELLSEVSPRSKRDTLSEK
jgi:hypothetical protein